MESELDLIGLELNQGLEFLKRNGLTYRLVESAFPGKKYPSHLLKRIVRQRVLPKGVIEITYSVDTYWLGSESVYYSDD